MSDASDAEFKRGSGTDSDPFDIVIVGAGISGVNTAYRIQTQLPGTRYTIFEARDAIGGTWDFFKYPGLRSDGFSWRPWLEKTPIATAGSILRYLRLSAADTGIESHIWLGSRVKSANWSMKSQAWEMTVISNNRVERVWTRFLVLGTGYYDYEEALPAAIPNLNSFAGLVVHPQFWPEDLDYTDKKVVCIGSGATAITLIPVLAEKAANVTMLQRSPSYIVSLPNPTSASFLQRCIPERIAYRLNRLYFMIFPILFYYFCRMFPVVSRNMIRKDAANQSPGNYPMDTNFAPRYNPFDQRLCSAPNGDFYAAIRNGGAKVVTDSIEQVVEDGIILKNGTNFDADIIITATGLKLRLGGNVNITVDGQPYSIADKLTWQNAMLQDLPNTVLVMGYTMASWTLGADATAFLLCRLLKGMRKHRLTCIVPRLPGDKSVQAYPLMALSSTYVLAAAEVLPKAGDKGPWRRRMNYFTDMFKVNYGDMTEGLESYQGDFAVTGVKF
ncbi:uncharacterized protein Z518_04599 [Rhinocladiella mackenziei CBS 650.93]|uniref:Uncharacterized protein n=1 Tax=Rhinocladiella mackenziei CBS 650.93 TaxID=1442369 RepID=A0A0D2H874_9EURO|nr:uncharacterized protein Z518_04599 [Rhinocladiella mackenziei CBS 650.93]KIX06623.1 hypothetical protein Z518_04599 [Rhinocladiella mackenziei CBS 650.93]